MSVFYLLFISLSINYFGLGNIADKILFVVDDKPVLLSDYKYYLSLKDKKNLNIPKGIAEFNDFKRFYIISVEAESKGYSVTREEMDRDRKMLAQQMMMNEDEMIKYVEDVMKIPRQKFIKLRKIFILDNYYLSSVLRNVKISDVEADNFYNQHKNEFKQEVVKVLLISSDNKIKPDKIYSPKDISIIFPDAVTQVSYVKRGEYYKYEKDLFGAKKGKLLGPIVSGKYYNYFFVLESKGERFIPFSAVKSRIKESMLLKKRDEKIEQEVEKIAKRHYVIKCFGVSNGEIDYNNRGSCGDRAGNSIKDSK